MFIEYNHDISSCKQAVVTIIKKRSVERRQHGSRLFKTAVRRDRDTMWCTGNVFPLLTKEKKYDNYEKVGLNITAL